MVNICKSIWQQIYAKTAAEQPKSIKYSKIHRTKNCTVKQIGTYKKSFLFHKVNKILFMVFVKKCVSIRCECWCVASSSNALNGSSLSNLSCYRDKCQLKISIAFFHIVYLKWQKKRKNNVRTILFFMFFYCLNSKKGKKKYLWE